MYGGFGRCNTRINVYFTVDRITVSLSGLSTEETQRLQELKSTNPEAYNREMTRLANQAASQQTNVTVSDSLKRGL